MVNWKQNSAIEKEGLRITKLLQNRGFKAFWVGGTVRDKFLGREIDNLDIATSARPSETEQILRSAKISSKAVGKEYGTILAMTKSGIVEITTFRKEGNYLYRRRPQEVVYIDDYIEDSKRRDLTINSFYYDPVRQTFEDPQNGKKDLQGKIIRFVGDPKKRIDEDALRMLRAVRFSVQLGFKLEKNSFAAIKTRAKYIQEISGERIKTELDKILSHPNKISGIKLLDELGLLRFVMPEVVQLKKVIHKSRKYHLEGNAFEHTLLVLKNTPDDATLSYASLYHDVGKATTAVPKKKEEGLVNSFPGHELVSAEMFMNFAKRLKFSRKERDLILWITKMHMKRVAFVRDMSTSKKIDLARHKYFPQLVELWRADALGNMKLVEDKIESGEPKAYEEGLKLLKNIQQKKKLIEKFASGKFILANSKLKSGPMIGVAKNVLENKIVYGEIKNSDDAKYFLKMYEKNT